MDGIMVCVKQVPNTANIKLDPVNHSLIREGVSSIMNPFDEYALDAALDCKERFGAKVGVVTMGPKQAEEILKYSLEKGADEAFLITDSRMAGSDTLITARVLYSFIIKTGYKNIFCGQETIDSSIGHIGPSLAELLRIPQAPYVSEIVNLLSNTIRIRVESENEIQILEVQLPAVLTFKKNSRTLRGRIRKAERRRIATLGLDDLGLQEDDVGLRGSPTWVIDVKIDENALNYTIVESSLSAFDRIKFILSGGIRENKNRYILKGSAQKIIDKLLEVLRPQ